MIVFDTETTGLALPMATPLEKQPHIIEFAAVKLDDKTLVQKGELEFMAHPGHALSDEIIKITGIRDSDLEGKPPFGAHVPELQKFFLGETTILAHNCEFDCTMLSIDLRRCGKEFMFPWPQQRLCSVELTSHIKGHRLKLADLYEIATKGGKFPNAHRAINDVKALCTCVRWLRKEKLL